MVKLQKPIPKQLGNKPKLDNPIKQKKQNHNKEKSKATEKNTKAKLLDTTPVKEAKAALKPAKAEKQKEKGKKVLIAGGKGPIAPPESPKPVEKPTKKEGGGKKKNVVKNGVENGSKAAVTVTLPKEKAANKKVSEKAPKSAPLAKVESAPVKEAPVQKTKTIPTKPKASVKAASKSAPTKSDASAKAPPQKKIEAPSPAVKSEEPIKNPKQNKKQKNKNKKTTTAPVVGTTETTEESKETTNPKKEKKKLKIAFRKAKLAAAKKPQTEKKQKAPPTFRYDPIPYDEEKFNAILNTQNIKKIADALKSTVEKEVSTKKSSIFEDYRYFLQVACFKIPNCPKRMVKLNLKHSLVDKDDDVLLVVPDLQRGAKIDYEPTKHHYEDLLRSFGVEGITVMPMNQLRKEYGTFEQKRRLCASYEYYMCDGRIISHVGAIVGKLTQKPRNTFHAVRLHEDKNIRTEIEKSLRRTAFRQIAKSSLQTIPVGTHKFTSQQLAENIELVLDQLKKVFPGGMGNVRSLYLKIGLTGTSALPLFISMGQAPENTPQVVGPREQKMIKLKTEANEVLSKFAMTKEGALVKLTKAGVEKKRKFMELKAALKDVEEGVSDKKKKKVSSSKETEEKKSAKELELERPENEEEGDDASSDDDDEVVQLGGSSDDDEDDDEMGALNDEDEDSETEILENGLVEDDDDEQDVNQSENEDDDDDDNDEDDDDDDDDEEDEEESD